MGHRAGSLRAEHPLSRRPRGHHWTAIGLAFCAIAGAGTTVGPGHLGRSGLRALPPGRRGQGPEGLREGERALRPGHRAAAHPRARSLPARAGRDVPVAVGRGGGRVREGGGALPGLVRGPARPGGAHEQLNRVDDAARAYEAALALRDQDDLRARLAFMLMKAGQQPRALPTCRRSPIGTPRPRRSGARSGASPTRRTTSRAPRRPSRAPPRSATMGAPGSTWAWCARGSTICRGRSRPTRRPPSTARRASRPRRKWRRCVTP